MTALREIGRSDPAFTAMCTALEAAQLPTADLFDAPARYFALGTEGYGGLVQLGNTGLLRSIVVAEERRGKGVGATILNGLLAKAREVGLEDVWLLTTTADEFFLSADLRASRAATPRTPSPARRNSNSSVPTRRCSCAGHLCRE